MSTPVTQPQAIAPGSNPAGADGRTSEESRLVADRPTAAHSITPEQAFAHMVKAMLGTGLLSLPYAFLHSGLYVCGHFSLMSHVDSADALAWPDINGDNLCGVPALYATGRLRCSIRATKVETDMKASGSMIHAIPLTFKDRERCDRLCEYNAWCCRGWASVDLWLRLPLQTNRQFVHVRGTARLLLRLLRIHGRQPLRREHFVSC